MQSDYDMAVHRASSITWILVANRTRATIFSSCGQHCPMTIVDRIENPRGRLSESELHANQPGRPREYSHVTPIRDESDRDQVQRSFTAQLASFLDCKRSDGAFDKLILIAADQLLSVLREQLCEATRRAIVVASNKDLIRPTQESLRSHLDGFARV